MYFCNSLRRDKARSSRGKEKLKYVENSSQRKVTLSRRKSTLFKNVFKLHVMTKAEVLLIVQPTKQHRIVWGSPLMKEEYANGALKPTVGQNFLSDKEMEGQSAGGTHDNGPTVDPMTATPEQRVDMSPTLANVLGHNSNSATMSSNTPGPENVPSLVQEVLRRRPRARLFFGEKAPVIREQTEITFISDETVITSSTYVHRMCSLRHRSP